MAGIDLDGRVFRSVSNSAGGDVDGATTFHYRQQGTLVWATYAGGTVAYGQLLATVRPDGRLDMRYHHVTTDGALKTGRCLSTPVLSPDGCLRLREQWTWTDGAEGSGESVVEQVDEPAY